MDQQNAENLAIAALGHIAGDSELLDRFLSLSGADPAHIREMAVTHEFQAAVLGFLRSDEALTIAFAANQGIDPGDLAKAQFALDPQSVQHG